MDEDSEIRLISDGDKWRAIDTQTTVEGSGTTRKEALDNLDKRVAVYEQVVNDPAAEIIRQEFGIELGDLPASS